MEEVATYSCAGATPGAGVVSANALGPWELFVFQNQEGQCDWSCESV